MKKLTDEETESFWVNNRVPRRYVKMFVFIEGYRRQHGQGPTWSEISEYMDWDLSRKEVRKIMRKGVMFGLRFRLNRERSTKIHPVVVPHLERLLEPVAA